MRNENIVVSWSKPKRRKMKYSKDVYEDFDLFDGDKDSDARCETQKLVKTRTPHVCNFKDKPHEIKVGSMAVIDEAIYEGKWQSQYFCTDCIDEWLEEFEPDGE